VSEHAVQTNEVQRCFALLPGFLEIQRRAGEGTPLDLVELGPSAGLNLVWDRYRYAIAGSVWSPTDARLTLTGRAEPPPPAALLDVRATVRSRVGIDLEPVDVRGEEGARTLEAFVWADQLERRERLRQAIAELRRDPPEIVRGDYVELLPGLLERRRRDGLTVVFQTASTQYLTREEHARLDAALESAGRAGPLAWLTTLRGEEVDEQRGYTLALRLWPGGAREELAVFDYHGEWLEWRER
jgi:hypothetical protein